MKLYYSSASPFVRKVNIVAIENGIDSKIKRIPTAVWDPETTFGRVNPLGKVPALELEGGVVLCDSPVICEYLDELAGGRLFPAKGPERWASLNLQALADGICDAAVLRLNEGRRSKNLRSEQWVDRLAGAIERTLDVLEKGVEGWPPQFDIGAISVAIALGYLDFRFSKDEWRKGRPKLAAWYAIAAERESMRKTIPEA